ncbi:MAG: ABC transporter permease [Rhizobiales bacterium]|nr:ABC transporter permease [Hyphomicrobiales bacterium]
MSLDRREIPFLAAMLIPVFVVFATFFLLPMAKLIVVAGSGENGMSEYLTVIRTPRHFESLVATVLLSAVTTLAALVISTISGVFLERNRFRGREALISMLTFPLAFPGVVIGFLVIMLAGRQGLAKEISMALTGTRLVFAYSMAGLFVGYLYFSIPRVILTLMAAAEKLDPALEEAARSLGASRWQVIRDVIVPALKPALIASGAICFATAMGAFGTAFTLATNIDVLPMTIYTEFTLNANFATAAALSIMLGIITWIALYIARSLAGSTVAAAA